jgi:hypothetical protein
LTLVARVRYDAVSFSRSQVSFEIITDGGSERFRDLISRTFGEALGAELQYGTWTVTLRSDRERLHVTLAGPDRTLEEWAFSLDRSASQQGMVDALRRRLIARPVGEARP